MFFIAQIKKLGKETFSYGLSSVLQKLISIFLFPIYARLLTPADFGIQDIVLSAVNILVMFLILGMDSGVVQHYYENDDLNKKKLVSTYMLFQIFVSVPVVLISVALAEPICNLIFKDPTLVNYFRLAVVAIPFSLMGGAMMNTLRFTFQTKKFVILSTFGILMQVSMAILLVIVYRLGVKGVLLSILISYLSQAILGLFLTYKDYSRKISFYWLPKLLKVGIPLVPAALSFWVMSYSNRFFLVTYASMEEVGLLSVVNRISSILLLFLSAFSAAWGPYAYNLSTDRELARVTYGKIFTLFMLTTLSASLGLSLFSRELILLLATAVYEKGYSLVFLYSFSSVLWVGMYILGMGTGLAKKNYHYTISVIAGALLNTLLNYLLIPKYGVAGAAYATLAGNLLATIYMFFAGQHYFKVTYDLKKVFAITIIIVVAAVFGIWVDSRFNSWEPILVLYKTFIVLFTLVLLIFSKVLTLSQLQETIDFFRKKPLVPVQEESNNESSRELPSKN
jgi:O-antigen/teichoic acid export membrane protein